MSRVLKFLVLWLLIGFAGGGLVLIGVAIPLEARLAAAGASQATRNVVLSGLALAWAIAAAAAAFALVRRLSARALAIAAGLAAAASGAVFALFLRAGAGPLASVRGAATVEQRFTFGAYPDAGALPAMRRDGYTGVISLLSPDIPFERVLIARERDQASAAGLAFRSIPMLPWISRNTEALDSLRALARRPGGRWYVHCYLGRHRVEVARYAIEEAAGKAAAMPRITLPDSLERGALVRVDSGLLLGPLPTRDEWFDVITRSGTRRVIAMLDPANPDDRPWIAAESTQAANTGLALQVMPVRTAADARRVADTVRASAAPTYAHGFTTDQRVAWLRAALARRATP